MLNFFFYYWKTWLNMQRTGEIASRDYWQLYPLQAEAVGKGSEWKLEGREILIKKRKYANIRMEEEGLPNTHCPTERTKNLKRWWRAFFVQSYLTYLCQPVKLQSFIFLFLKNKIKFNLSRLCMFFSEKNI